MGGAVLAAIFATRRCVSGRTWNDMAFRLPTKVFVLFQFSKPTTLSFYSHFLFSVPWVFSPTILSSCARNLSSEYSFPHSFVIFSFKISH